MKYPKAVRYPSKCIQRYQSTKILKTNFSSVPIMSLSILYKIKFIRRGMWDLSSWDPPEAYVHSWKEVILEHGASLVYLSIRQRDTRIRRHARNVTVTRRGIVCTRDILHRRRDLKSIDCDLEGRLILRRGTTAPN